MATKTDTSISAKPTPGMVPADELDLLAEIYRFVLRCGEERRKKSGPESRPDDAKESNGSVATENYTK